jgi:hypothetical protein
MVSVTDESNPFASISTSAAMASPTHSSDSFASSAAAPQPAPASVVQNVNIKSHVPVMLDMNEPNYTQWRCFFDSVLGKFGLEDHVLSPPGLAARDIDWK